MKKITNLFQVFTFFYVFCIFCLWTACLLWNHIFFSQSPMLVTFRNLLSFLSLSSVVSLHPWVSLIHSVHPFWLNNCAHPKGSRHVRAVLSELLILPLELYSFSHSPNPAHCFQETKHFSSFPGPLPLHVSHHLEPWSLGGPHAQPVADYSPASGPLPQSWSGPVVWDQGSCLGSGDNWGLFVTSGK